MPPPRPSSPSLRKVWASPEPGVPADLTPNVVSPLSPAPQGRIPLVNTHFLNPGPITHPPLPFPFRNGGQTTICDSLTSPSTPLGTGLGWNSLWTLASPLLFWNSLPYTNRTPQLPVTPPIETGRTQPHPHPLRSSTLAPSFRRPRSRSHTRHTPPPLRGDCRASRALGVHTTTPTPSAPDR